MSFKGLPPDDDEPDLLGFLCSMAGLLFVVIVFLGSLAVGAVFGGWNFLNQ